ncbi:putative tail fiber protein [Corynebacterium phage phi16]|uniref:hypothetical protein n=1 Tax=Corynebacterium glutamicum TaxID=1718 RepID=UPI0009455A0A|nr:hypothetical protein [Corynebacterium glutamicum]APQ42525.1 putative tail fiber protein [Corynebacterium phage phi16]OKX80481.1 hypothetical protein AUO95_10010 [Corynebacterium glutamicum]
MTLVSGLLSTVTTEASAVTQVEISINTHRTTGTGLMTAEQKMVAVTGGNFSSQIAPGNAAIALIIAGRKSAPIPILVDDVDTQTLAQVIDAARLATGETQESLAAFVQQVLAVRQEVLGVADDVTTEKNAALSGISTLRDSALGAINNASGGSLTQINTARSDALNQINQNSASALTDVGTAKNTALTEIGMEVARAEDAADRAESAVNDGVGDGSVTLAKLAQDVKDQIGAKAEMSEVEQALEAKPDPDTVAMMISQAIAGLVGSAPQALDTVYELAAYLTDPGVASGLVQQLAGKAPTSHDHTMAQISNLPTVTASATGSALVQRWSTGQISVPTTPDNASAASSKAYIDLEAGKRILKSGTAATVWSGTQAQYDALTNAVKNAAGFIAVITA